MANLLEGKSLQKLVLGAKSVRPAEAVAIVATPGDPFWDVHGCCLITSLIGICTVTPGGANNMFFEFNPDGTAATSDLTATADLGTAGVDGGVHVLVGAPATALSAATIGTAVLGVTAGAGIVCYEGVIGLTADAALGTYIWILTYVALTDGAWVEIV